MITASPSNAGGVGLIPGQGAKISHGQNKIKQKEYCNKFNKDFKNGPHQKIFLKKERDWVQSDTPPRNGRTASSMLGDGHSYLCPLSGRTALGAQFPLDPALHG